MKTLVLGAGMTAYPGAVKMDIKPFKGIDSVCDISKDKFPCKDNEFDLIIAENVFEHIGWSDTEDGLVHCLDECWRILKPTGELKVIVPHFPSDSAICHPEHRRFFVKNSFSFWQVPAGGVDLHGYSKHFWHCGIDETQTNENFIHAVMIPNKKGCKYGYKKIVRRDLT
jgi:hypothetical protein